MSLCSCWTLVSGRWKTSCDNQVFCLQRGLKKMNFPIPDSRMIFTSCCLQHPSRVHRVQYVRVCPRFPLPDSFPPGRLSWDGDWQKGRREPIKEVLVLPLMTKGAGISRMICLHCSPPRQCDCVTICGCRQPQR